jgi:hypothetical protein
MVRDFEVIKQLAEQLRPFTLVLRPAATSSLVPFSRSAGPIKYPDELNVELHEMENAPHDSFLYRVCRWLFRPDECDLLWREVIEPPARLVHGHTKRPSVCLVVISGILCELDQFAFTNHIP